MCVANSATLNRFTRTGLRDAPNDVRVFFFAINVHGSTRYSKNGVLDQIDGIYTLFLTKTAKSIPYFTLEMLENDTLWGGTYLYGLDMGVSSPPPPPPGMLAPLLRTCGVSLCPHSCISLFSVVSLFVLIGVSLCSHSCLSSSSFVYLFVLIRVSLCPH